MSEYNLSQPFKMVLASLSLALLALVVHRFFYRAKNKLPKAKKLVIYDFDCTLTSKHLYDKLGKYTSQEQARALHAMKQEELVEIFGGQDRIDQLAHHFKKLSFHNVPIIIISHGFTEVIKSAMKRVKLYKYFKNSFIFGRDAKALKQVCKAICIKEQFLKIKNQNILTMISYL